MALKRKIALAIALACLPTLARAEPPMRHSETKFYRLHTDVAPEVAADYAKRLDAMFEEYRRRLSVFTQNRELPRSDVYLFSRESDYRLFTKDGPSNSAGVYKPSTKALAILVDRRAPARVRATLQHEAMHQFVDASLHGDLPAWLDEGLAELFGEGLYDGRGFIMGQVSPEKLRSLQYLVREKKLSAFDTFTKLDGYQWNTAVVTSGEAYYTQAWAMVHFLVYAVDTKGNLIYRERFYEMLKDLRNGASPREAFESNFSTNYAGFQQRFSEYAMQLTPTPEAKAMERVQILADLYKAFLNNKESFSTITEFQAALAQRPFTLEYSGRWTTFSTDGDPQVYFRDEQKRPIPPSLLWLDRDTICYRASDGRVYRARVYRAGDRWQIDSSVTAS